MKSSVTRGAICARDEETLVEYRVAFITYTIWENDEFCYEIEPDYRVIDLLSPPLFQGIPGLNLDLRRKTYVRKNQTPVFVSERVPAENREDVRALMAAEGMDYLNKLEWLIRTKTRYSGDSLYVRRRDEQDNAHVLDLRGESTMSGRSADAMRRLLNALGRGQTVIASNFVIDDKNRAVVHNLLRDLYHMEKSYLDRRRSEGTARAVRAGKYPGRQRKRVDDIRLQDACERHMKGKLTASEAAEQLGVSLATFHRRYREFREKQAGSQE